MISKRFYSAIDEDFLDALTASDEEFRTDSSASSMFCRNVK